MRINLKKRALKVGVLLLLAALPCVALSQGSCLPNQTIISAMKAKSHESDQLVIASSDWCGDLDNASRILLLDENNRLYLLVAGNPSPGYRLELPRLINVPDEERSLPRRDVRLVTTSGLSRIAPFEETLKVTFSFIESGHSLGRIDQIQLSKEHSLIEFQNPSSVTGRSAWLYITSPLEAELRIMHVGQHVGLATIREALRAFPTASGAMEWIALSEDAMASREQIAWKRKDGTWDTRDAVKLSEFKSRVEDYLETFELPHPDNDITWSELDLMLAATVFTDAYDLIRQRLQILGPAGQFVQQD